MAKDEIESVKAYRDFVDSLLVNAAEVKHDHQIDPPLTESDFNDAAWKIEGTTGDGIDGQSQQAHFAAVETAFREKFYDLLASTSIEDPAFIEIWNLLDIIAIFSDKERCEPGLGLWLIEELLDSQTIDGCRKVFDYLESRRERIIAKHFTRKNLIILRSCNELLRRLSRAEDTVFCGRVFIFLFQSFPLGDKSSVNLRGEYHVENVTTFDDRPTKLEEAENAMDIDETNPQPDSTENNAATPVDAERANGTPVPIKGADEVPKVPKLVKFNTSKEDPKPTVDMDNLYPMFWTLQANFSAPTRLFNSQHFASFKAGLAATLSTFTNVNSDFENRGPSKSSDDLKKGSKRKRGGEGNEPASSFNPKYLTSRDLFELEINDVAFRRHILVQALILLDFLLSLAPKAKTKLADGINKSVLYSYTLSDEDATWASEAKTAIASYLQQGPEGKFYYRMVDTVLSRDKNWVRWKAENCPLIELPAVSIQQYLDAQNTAQRVCTNKRLRPTPLRSLDLSFLSEDESLTSLNGLTDPERFAVPVADSFSEAIAADDREIESAMTEADKQALLNAKASKTWRILRIASKSKLNLFDKIEDGKNLKVLFETSDEPVHIKADEGDGESSLAQAEPQDETENLGAVDGQTIEPEGPIATPEDFQPS